MLIVFWFIIGTLKMIKYFRILLGSLQNFFEFVFIAILVEFEKIYPKSADPKMFALMAFILYVLFIFFPLFIYIPFMENVMYATEKWMFVLFGTIGFILLSEFYFNGKRIYRLRKEFEVAGNRRKLFVIAWSLAAVAFIIHSITMYSVLM